MHSITISPPAHTHTYSINVGAGLLQKLADDVDFQPYSKVAIITDQTVAKLWLEAVQHSIPLETTAIILPAGETHKTSDSLHAIWSQLLEMQCDRNSLVITLGGGVIGDMGGFAAATYMRGIDCIHIPTTLLAQIDSSIGGKTAIDFHGVKNLIGTFTQPKAVIIDTHTLETLPRREFLSGFAEMIKHGLIQDATYLEKVASQPPQDFTDAELADIIAHSCQIKAEVVEADETEGGARKKLNFGHTVGHAIESLSLETDQPLLHGEAVSIGMCIEAQLSVQKGLLTTAQARRVQHILQNAGLPTTSPHFPLPDILRIMRSDKKNSHGAIRFTLLQNIGKAIWDQHVDETTLETVITHAMEET